MAVPPPPQPAREGPPTELEALAERRAQARLARDYATADRLKAAIEAAGWKVVDRGVRWRLERAVPPDVVEGERTLYGSSSSVPSRLAEPDDARFSVILISEDRPLELARCLAGLRRWAPGGTQVVLVANDPGPEQAARLARGQPDVDPIAGREPEVVWTSTRLGYATARAIGLRRASGRIVVFADARVEPTGDPLTPCAMALDDPDVAVAGPTGLASSDLNHFAVTASAFPVAIGGEWLAFRRADAAAAGTLDERFVVGSAFDVWWSLVLRAGAEGSPPRQARAVALPLVQYERDAPDASASAEIERQGRRNAYRVLDRFRGRADLASPSS